MVENKRSFFVSFLFIFVFGLSARAQSPVPLSSYLVKDLPVQKMDQIADQFEVVRKTSGGFEVLVPQNKSADLLSLAPHAQLLELDISEPVRDMFQKSRKLKSEDRYHSYSEVIETLESTAKAHPETTRLVRYGVSKKGQPLLALRVSKQFETRDSAPRSVPRILLTAATHGDEIITTEVLLQLMEEFVSQGKSNPRFAQILEKLEVVFIPVVNADGFMQQDRYDDNRDPNRSYPYPMATAGNPTPSIAAEMKFIEDYPIVGSLDFHAYSALVMYPWGYTRDPLNVTAKEKFTSVTSRMAATNDYGYGQISEILYIAKGSSSDFYFWKYQTFALAVEVGQSKAPYPSEISRYVQEQQESTWIFLESFLEKNQTLARPF